MAKDLAAHVSAYAHGGAAAAPYGANGGDDLGKSNGKHDPTGVPNEIHIALGHAFINDLGIERWEIECGGRGEGLKHEHCYEIRRVWCRPSYENANQIHGLAPLSLPWLGSRASLYLG